MDEFDAVVERLRRALEGSVAERAEIVWCESVRGFVSTRRGSQSDPPERHRSVTVHVTEAGRSGFHRLSAHEVSDLASALRLALVDARLGNRAAPAPALLPDLPPSEMQGLFDAAIEAWTPQEAGSQLQSWLATGECGGDGCRGELSWGVLRLVHVSGDGGVQRAAATGVSLSVRSGDSRAPGLASGAARTLADFQPAAIVERSRQRVAPESGTDSGGGPTGLTGGTLSLVLAPEAAARLLELFASSCLAAEAFRRGRPLSLSHLARTLASPLLSLTDDGTDRTGLAFPIDFDGRAKRPVLLLEDGRLLSPAVDLDLAHAHSLAPTASSLGPGDSRPAHLVVVPGASSEAELIAAGDGVWVSALDAMAIEEETSTRFRGWARGARRIEEGRLGSALEDFRWEGDLLEALRGIVGVGRERITVCHDPSFYGGTVCPALRWADLRLA